MNISLRRELEDFVSKQVREGRYATTEAMVEEALAMLYDRDYESGDFSPEHEAIIRQRLAQAQEDVRQGRVHVVNDQGLHLLMEEIKQRGRRRIAATNPASS